MQYCTNNFWEDTFNFTFPCLSRKSHMDCGMASNFNIMSIYLTLILKIVSFVNTWILNSAHFSSTYDLRSTIENIVVMKVLWQPHIFIYQIYQLFNKRRNWKGCSWCKLLKRPWAEIRHHDSLVKIQIFQYPWFNYICVNDDIFLPWQNNSWDHWQVPVMSLLTG